MPPGGGRRSRCARRPEQYAGSVDGTQITGSSGSGDTPGTALANEPEVSTGCIAAVAVAVLAVLVIAPAVLWGLGIACGAR